MSNRPDKCEFCGWPVIRKLLWTNAEHRWQCVHCEEIQTVIPLESPVEVFPHRIIYLHPRSKLASWPREWMHRYYNGRTNQPCDMLEGPCACGAWHHAAEWMDPNDICSRKIFGVPVAKFYNAEILPLPESPTREQLVIAAGEEYVAEMEADASRQVQAQEEQRTLSYF